MELDRAFMRWKAKKVGRRRGNVLPLGVDGASRKYAPDTGEEKLGMFLWRRRFRGFEC